jgi:hypothetical protein
VDIYVQETCSTLSEPTASFMELPFAKDPIPPTLAKSIAYCSTHMCSVSGTWVFRWVFAYDGVVCSWGIGLVWVCMWLDVCCVLG